MYEVSFSIKDLTLLFTALLGFLYSIFFFRSASNKDKSSFFLGFFLLIGSINVALIATALDKTQWQGFSADEKLNIANLSNFHDYLIWLEGISLLLFVRSLFFKGKIWTKADILHGLFPLAILFTQVATYYQYDQSTRLSILSDINPEMQSPTLIISLIVSQFSRIAYALLCVWTLYSFKASRAEQISNEYIPGLTWLKLLVFGYLISRSGWAINPIMDLSAIASDLPPRSYYFDSLRPMYIIFDFLWLGCLCGLIYFALNHAQRFYRINQPENYKQRVVRYSDEQVERLTDYMKNRKPYLNTDLTIDKLAESVSRPSKVLSRIINSHFNKNFSEYIDYHRIKEAEQLLSATEHTEMNITQIAIEVGFNSKSVFNKYFKKPYECTPIQYRKSLTSSDL